jgi:hypothetical protein
MKKLPIKDKIFWKNFIYFILFFLIITIALAYYSEDYEKAPGFVVSYIITSTFCVLLLGVKIGQKYANYENINEKQEEFLKKENISIQEFRKKYNDIISIYDESVRLSDYKENKVSTTNRVNNVLTDTQIINFLKYIQTKNIDKYHMWSDLYELLDKYVFLKEIFKEDEYSYSLRVMEIGADTDFLVALENGGPGGGSGCLYRLSMDGEEVLDVKEEEIWHFDN